MTVAKRRGITIVETILYVGLLAIIMAGLMTFLVNLVRREAKVSAMIEANQTGRFALEKINSVIRNSKDATSPTDGTSGSSLSLTMPDSNLSPTVFQVTSGVLTMKQGANAAIPLTSSGVTVSNLTFTNLVDPVAHARTAPGWVPCTDGQNKGVWYCVICHVSDQKDYCWNRYPAYKSLGWFGLLLDLVLGKGKLGSCLQATAPKSVIRTTFMVTAPAGTVTAGDYAFSESIYGTATVPRQN